MNLALFDLDHTILPLDSDYEWGEFLVNHKIINTTIFRKANKAWYADYQAGILDIMKYLEFTLNILTKFSREQLNEWHKQFMKEIIEPAILPAGVSLVKKHINAGDLVAIITATNSFVTMPIAKLFDVNYLIATQPEFHKNGRFTGRVVGIPTYGKGKIIHTDQWLKTFGKTLQDFKQSYFYSDSQNDIPLLSYVTHPVATNPNAALKAYAIAQGWPILNLFNAYNYK